MAARKDAVPAGYGAVTPYLRVRKAADAIAFYKKALGAKLGMKLTMPDGRIGHAELDFAGSKVMLADEFPEMGVVGPATLKGTTVSLSLYTTNVDRLAARAEAAGAKVLRPPRDEFYGDRTARIQDPFGHEWSLQQRLMTVSPKEMQKRIDAMASEGKPPKSRAKKRKA
jgi:PhnB protein